MSARFILDTCTLSYFLHRNAQTATPALCKRIVDVLQAEPPCLSIVSVYEVDRGLQRLLLEGRGANKRRVFSLFLAGATVLEMDEPVWRGAAALHAASGINGIVFSEADLFILVTARIHGRVLLSTDAALVANATTMNLGTSVELLPVA